MSFAHWPIRMRLALSSWALLLCMAAYPAFGCQPGAIRYKELVESDVIATGTIYIVQQTKQQNESETVTEGIAEIRVGEVLQNRTALAAPFTFHFKQIKDDGCIFGDAPSEGSAVKVYLRRLSPGADDLGLYYIESTGD